MGGIIDRIKNVFRASTKRDFDSLVGKDGKEELRIVRRLDSDLASKEPEARRRAARLMAATRLRPATYYLAKYIADPDPAVSKACRDGLVAIGGPSVGQSLVMHCFDRKPNAMRRAAMDVFQLLHIKGEFEDESQSRSVGKFTLLSGDPIAQEASALLASMGRHGGPGLLVGALETTDVDHQARAIAKVAEAKYYRGTRELLERFLVEPKGDPAASRLHDAASEAIRSMGEPAVRYLVDALGGAAGRGAARVASKITGLSITPDDHQLLRDWWEAHQPKDVR